MQGKPKGKPSPAAAAHKPAVKSGKPVAKAKRKK